MASESAPAAAPVAPQSYSTDPALYIYTSLTAGSSHIVTATSRLETILRANRVPFKAIDIAVDEKARMLWGRRAGKDANGRQRKIPGLVQMGLVLGDLVEIEEWNEYGELKQHVEIYYDDFTIPSKAQAPPPIVQKPVTTSKPSLPPVAPPNPVKATTPAPQHPASLPIRSIVEEAAQKAKKIQLDALRSKAAAASAKVQENEQDKEAKKEETPVGLQSPTSTGWKSSGDKTIETTIQSPTTTSWKAGSLPKDVDPPVTNLHGSPIERVSKEEIEAVERAEAIKEVSSEEEEESSEEEEEEEEEKPVEKPVEKKGNNKK